MCVALHFDFWIEIRMMPVVHSCSVCGLRANKVSHHGAAPCMFMRLRIAHHRLK